MQDIVMVIPANATSATKTIKHVDAGRSVILIASITTNSNKWISGSPRLELTNATTITAYKDTISTALEVGVVARVIELTPKGMR